MFTRVAAAAVVIVGLLALLSSAHPPVAKPSEFATRLSAVSELGPAVCDLGSAAPGAAVALGPPDVAAFIECLRLHGRVAGPFGPPSG